MQKFHNFTRNKFDLWIKWITRKMKTRPPTQNNVPSTQNNSHTLKMMPH